MVEINVKELNDAEQDLLPFVKAARASEGLLDAVRAVRAALAQYEELQKNIEEAQTAFNGIKAVKASLDNEIQSRRAELDKIRAEYAKVSVAAKALAGLV